MRTRARILGAAAQLFADKGCPGVTILDVAQLSDITKGAVYFHFANKEALAIAVADEFYHQRDHFVARNGSGGRHVDRQDPPTLATVLVSAFFGAQHISWVLNNRSDLTPRTLAIIRTVIPCAEDSLSFYSFPPDRSSAQEG